MAVSRQLKKQIIIEVIALVFLICVIIYALFAIQKSSENKIISVDGMVIVLDDSKYDGMDKSSDGVGLSSDGTTYTITNNNSDKVDYKVVIVPNIHDEKVLKQIRVSADDLYIENLTDLERINGGYAVATNKLDAGFTKVHLIKTWYKLDTLDSYLDEDIQFEYRLVRDEK